MRKIASHYYLKPNGEVGKNPILTFDDSNKIIEIRERDAFEEEAGLELVNGFLTPSFINVIPKLKYISKGNLEAIIKCQKINGVRVLGVDKCDLSIFEGIANKKILFKTSEYCQEKRSLVINIFESLCNDNSGLNELLLYTCRNAIDLKVHEEFGSLEVGKKPGLLAISAMNYKRFTLSNKSKLKIVI